VIAGPKVRIFHEYEKEVGWDGWNFERQLCEVFEIPVLFGVQYFKQ